MPGGPALDPRVRTPAGPPPSRGAGLRWTLQAVVLPPPPGLRLRSRVARGGRRRRARARARIGHAGTGRGRRLGRLAGRVHVDVDATMAAAAEERADRAAEQEEEHRYD